MISRWARQEWEAFAAAMSTGDKTATQQALQRFLVGVAYRMEDLQAHEMAELLEATSLPDEDRASLLDDIQFSLSLLATYGRLVGDGEDDSDMWDDDAPVGPGDLVI
ncbi:MAG TPA: hypothetical protein VNA57_01510 [Acidimicrobiales bacterium]|nr:hypothetical protein [Acidimicrobiales bacterium]